MQTLIRRARSAAERLPLQPGGRRHRGRRRGRRACAGVDREGRASPTSVRRDSTSRRSREDWSARQQRTFSEFKVPDTLAVGFSAAPTINFLITTEYTRVFHSQLRADYVDVLVNQGESRTRADRFSIDDAGEIHVGAEYLLPVARRPGHPRRRLVRARPLRALRADAGQRPAGRADRRQPLVRPRSVALHGGARFAMPACTRVCDFSVGVDYSSRSTLVSISTIVGF